MAETTLSEARPSGPIRVDIGHHLAIPAHMRRFAHYSGSRGRARFRYRSRKCVSGGSDCHSDSMSGRSRTHRPQISWAILCTRDAIPMPKSHPSIRRRQIRGLRFSWCRPVPGNSVPTTHSAPHSAVGRQGSKLCLRVSQHRYPHRDYRGPSSYS
jgi:hypothetical protein